MSELAALEREVKRLQAALEKCRRLDKAAGEAGQMLSMREWIAHRLRMVCRP